MMSKSFGAKRVEIGDRVAARELVTISGEVLKLPGIQRVHLQFRRFAGCPICNVHLRSLARRHAQLAMAGITEVVVFHSSASELRPHVGDLPFAVIADPDKQLYRAFGVEASPLALLDPRVWPSLVRSIGSAATARVSEQRPLPPLNPRGGRLGLPADFLIAPNGQVLARKYGDHADDQWGVDELLALDATADRGQLASPLRGATSNLRVRP